MRRATLSLVALLILSVSPSLASARAQRSLGYRYDQVWRAAVRLVRVDMGYEISERDRDNGYLLFQYNFGGSPLPASIELIREGEGEDERVRIQVSVGAMPQVEQIIVNRLRRKLEDDFGRERSSGSAPHTWWDRDDLRRDREREEQLREREGQSEEPTEDASDD